MPEPTEEQKQQQQQQSEEWRNKDEVKKIIADRDSYKSQLSTLKAQIAELEKVKGEFDQIKTQQQKSKQEEERKKLEEAGEYQKIIEQNKSTYEKQLNDMRQSFLNKLIPSCIRDAAMKVPNILPNAIDDLIPAVKDQIGVSENFDVFIKGENGNPKLSEKDGKPLPLESYLTDYVKAKPWFLADTQPTNKGLKPGQLSDGKQVKTLNEMTDKEREEYRKSNPEGYKQMLSEVMSPEYQMKMARENLAKRQQLNEQLSKRT